MASSHARVVKSRVVYRGPVFGVRQDVVIEPGRVRAVRALVTHPGSVVLLPVFADGRLLLVRQYRHAVRRFLWELVAGRMEPGESPMTAARRELQEETGYTARRFRRLLEIIPTPGFVSERMLIYLAEGLARGAARPEADERIAARRFHLTELLRLVQRGSLRDAKSVAAILYYARFIRRTG